MGQKYTNATPAGIPRSRSKRTRARRKEYFQLRRDLDRMIALMERLQMPFENVVNQMICVSTLPNKSYIYEPYNR